MPEGPFGFPRLTRLGPLSKQTVEEMEREWDECPESGKEREICRSLKVNAIRILEGDIEDEGLMPDFLDRIQCDDLISINEGRCGIVASETLKDIDGIRVLKFGDGDHYWIEYNGWHYDAEMPTGVRSWDELPIFRRIPPREMLRFAQEAAMSQGERPPEFPDEAVKDATDEVLSSQGRL